MMAFFVRLLALAMLVGLAFAACNGEDAQPEPQAQQTAAPSSEPEEPQSESGPAADQDYEGAEQAVGDAGDEAVADDQAEPDSEEQADLPEEAGDDDAADDDPELIEWTVGGERPTALYAPAGYDGKEPLPLVLLLHGYASTATAVKWYFGGMHLLVNEARFALLLPQGRPGSDGLTFWDATPACCEFTEIDSDDVAYLTGIADETRELVNVSGVYIVGNSNGGFMAYRMACEGTIPDLRAVVSMAGSSFENPDVCVDAAPVSVLQIHGTEDAEVRYEGTDDVRRLQTDDESSDGHPGAVELVQRWAERLGCNLPAAETGQRLDLVPDLDGAETAATRYRTGCADGTTAELWSIEGGGHSPAFAGLGAAVLSWIAEAEEHRQAGRAAAEGETMRPVGTLERPASLLAPGGRKREETLPLVLLLHGYGGDAAAADWYLRLGGRIDEDQFALLLADGRTDETGAQFWDPRPESEDVPYLAGLVDEARGHLNLNGVYIVGYSNGGFMTYAMACSGRILDLRGVASLAGSSFEDPARCEAPHPISVLHIHGDADTVIPYAGYEGVPGLSAAEEGSKPETSDDDDGFPGAAELARRWAGINGCDLDAAETLARIDIDQSLPGAETVPTRYRQGCSDGTAVELWTIEGGSHGPALGDGIGARILAWLRGGWSEAGE